MVPRLLAAARAQSRSQSPRYPCPAEREVFVFPFRWTRVTRAMETRMARAFARAMRSRTCADGRRRYSALLYAPVMRKGCGCGRVLQLADSWLQLVEN